MKKILCICLSSTIQRTVSFNNFCVNNVNRSEKYRQDASGKAVNSARVLNQLENGCAKIICPLGEKNQDLFLKLASNNNLDIDFVTIPGFTRECWTLLNKSQNTTTELVVNEPNFTKDENIEIKFLKLIDENLPFFDAVLIAGSRPSFWNEDIYSTICGMVEDNKKILLVDFIGKDLQKMLQTVTPTIIKINEEEFCSTFNFDFPISEEKLKQEICNLSQRLKNIVIITRGENSTFASQNGKFIEIHTEKITPINTTACGDSFNAGFLYEFINSNDFLAALKKGTFCATKNAMLEIPGGY